MIQRVVALLAPPAIVDGGGGGDKAGMEEKEGEASTSDSPSPPPPPAVVYSASEAHDNAGQLLVEIIRVSRYFALKSWVEQIDSVLFLMLHSRILQ